MRQEAVLLEALTEETSALVTKLALLENFDGFRASERASLWLQSTDIAAWWRGGVLPSVSSAVVGAI
jgi:hypothetical protein